MLFIAVVAYTMIASVIVWSQVDRAMEIAQIAFERLDQAHVATLQAISTRVAECMNTGFCGVALTQAVTTTRTFASRLLLISDGILPVDSALITVHVEHIPAPATGSLLPILVVFYLVIVVAALYVFIIGRQNTTYTRFLEESLASIAARDALASVQLAVPSLIEGSCIPLESNASDAPVFTLVNTATGTYSTADASTATSQLELAICTPLPLTDSDNESVASATSSPSINDSGFVGSSDHCLNAIIPTVTATPVNSSSLAPLFAIAFAVARTVVSIQTQNNDIEMADDTQDTVDTTAAEEVARATEVLRQHVETTHRAEVETLQATIQRLENDRSDLRQQLNTLTSTVQQTALASQQALLDQQRLSDAASSQQLQQLRDLFASEIASKDRELVESRTAQHTLSTTLEQTIVDARASLVTQQQVSDAASSQQLQRLRDISASEITVKDRESATSRKAFATSQQGKAILQQEVLQLQKRMMRERRDHSRASESAHQSFLLLQQQFDEIRHDRAKLQSQRLHAQQTIEKEVVMEVVVEQVEIENRIVQVGVQKEMIIEEEQQVDEAMEDVFGQQLINTIPTSAAAPSPPPVPVSTPSPPPSIPTSPIESPIPASAPAPAPIPTPPSSSTPISARDRAHARSLGLTPSSTPIPNTHFVFLRKPEIIINPFRRCDVEPIDVPTIIVDRVKRAAPENEELEEVSAGCKRRKLSLSKEQQSERRREAAINARAAKKKAAFIRRTWERIDTSYLLRSDQHDEYVRC